MVDNTLKKWKADLSLSCQAHLPPHDKSKKQKCQLIANHSGHSCYFHLQALSSLELELLAVAVDCSFMLSIEDTQQSDRPDCSNSLAEETAYYNHIQRR